MAASRYVRPTVSVLPATNPLLAPQPPIAPLTPPVHAVALMTEAGSAAFGAVWRGIEAKLVECPALLFAAQEDALVSPEAVEAVAVELAADFVLIPHAGHGLTLDPCSEEICRQIDRWLTTGNLPDV